MTAAADRIERKILLKAPRSRVWRALTNAEEFGNWFGVALKGRAFTAGQRTTGQITYPGYEHIVFEVVVESGFDSVPAKRRPEAFRMNSSGWDEQMENIAKHVAKA